VNQFQSFLKAGIAIKQRKAQEDLAVTALGSQGDSKSIQRAMSKFGNDEPQPQPSGISPEEFSKRFNGGL